MNYGRQLNLRAYVMFIVDLFRTYRPPSLTSSTMDITWAPSSVVSFTDPCSSPQGGSWTHLPFTVLVLRRNLDSVTSLADTLKTEFVILWILSVYCSTTSRRNSNLMPHCSIPYPLCEHFGIKRDNKIWLHCVKVVHISLRYHSSGGVKVRGPD